MDVIFRMLRHIVVDDMADIGDIQPPTSNIRGDEHFVFAIAESAQ